MESNNLFKHADKELVIDAFLCWLIEEMNKKYLLKFKHDFVRNFLGVGKSEVQIIDSISSEKQKNKVDVICTLNADTAPYKVLFENKLYSTVHNDQLNTYKEENSDVSKFIYFKIGYVHRLDKIAAASASYEIRSAEDIERLLRPYAELYPHSIINEFYSFINQYLILPKKAFKNYFLENKYKMLISGDFQHFLMERIYNELRNHGWDEKDLKFKIGNNRGGSAWTQLDFSQIEKKYGDFDETLFFRIDKRAGMYYIRVNLYSQKGSKYWSEKKLRRDKLRDVASDFIEAKSLNGGKVYNNARNETEVVIFFLDENKMESVVNHSAKLASELKTEHQRLG